MLLDKHCRVWKDAEQALSQVGTPGCESAKPIPPEYGPPTQCVVPLVGE
jgi:hypothetical protein